MYNMAAYPRPGSPEWMWAQQMQKNQHRNEPPGPTLADFQAFNLRPRSQAPQRNSRPGTFTHTAPRGGVPPPPYHMANHNQNMLRSNVAQQGGIRNRNSRAHGMMNSTPHSMMNSMRNNTPQGMMRHPQGKVNSRLYQPPAHSRPSPNPIEGLQGLVARPHGPSPPSSLHNTNTPQGPSPLSYMESVATHPVGSQVRGHLPHNLQPNISSHYLPHPYHTLPRNMNGQQPRCPPPLMNPDGTLVGPMEPFSGPWTSGSGNVGYRPNSLNDFPPGNRIPSDQNRISSDQLFGAAHHGGQSSILSRSADCNETSFHQASGLRNTSSAVNAERESPVSQTSGALSNSIFGRWYKPPEEDEGEKYNYIFDEDSDVQTCKTEKCDMDSLQAKNSSHLIKRPSKLSKEEKGTKGRRLEGEISRIFSSFQPQLSPLGTSCLPESRTECETEPDIFSGRNGSSNISNESSHPQAASSHNNMSSSNNLRMSNHQFLSLPVTTSQSSTREIDKHGSQNCITHSQVARTIASTNAQTIQQVNCPASRPMPPLMLAPMISMPSSLPLGQQLPLPALTILTTNFSAPLLPKDSNIPVVSQSNSLPPSVDDCTRSSRSTDHERTSCEGSDSNLRILETFSLSQAHHVGDIVIQPHEPNVNQEGPNSSVPPNIRTTPENVDQAKAQKRKSNESDFHMVCKEKKVTPLRIRLPLAVKSQIREKLKKDSIKNKTNDEAPEKQTRNQLVHGPGFVTEESRTPNDKVVDRLDSSSLSTTEESHKSHKCSGDKNTQQESVQHDFDRDLTDPNVSLATTMNLGQPDQNEKGSEHVDPTVMRRDKSPVAVKDAHNEQSLDQSNDSHVDDRLKEVVSKISSGRKRRKSAVLLDSQPDTPESKFRRVSKGSERDFDGTCLKSMENNAAETVSQHPEKTSEKGLGACDDLPQLVRRPRMRKIRVSKRPWTLNTGLPADNEESKTEESDLLRNTNVDENKRSQGSLLVDNSKEDIVDKSKSEIERCKERTKALRLKLKRISIPPSSLKDLCSETIGMDTMKKSLENEQKSKPGYSDSVKPHGAECIGKPETTLGPEKEYGDKSIDENRNNNSSDSANECVTTPTITTKDSHITNKSPVKASGLVTVVCHTESLCSDEVALVRNSNNETLMENSSANAQTDSSVKEISNEEIQVESDDEVEIIDDTFDIGLVSELFFSVIFHGSKLLCITCLSGKYFVVRELLNKCFIDIAEKNKKKGVFLSKLFKQVYIAKERDLNIPYMELPVHLRPSVGEYLTKEKLLRNGLVCHIGIIHVNDAKRLYHFFYGVKSCHDLKCVSQWPPKETKNEAVMCKSNQDESRPEKSNDVDDQIDGDNFTDETDTADGDVEIISCQVIYDRNVTSDGSDTESQKSMSTKEPSRTSVDGEKRSKGRKKSPRSGRDWHKEKLLQRKRKGRQPSTSGDKGDLSDDSDATIPYMDDPETETDAECDQGRISSSASRDNSENTEKARSPALSGAAHSGDDISDVSAPVVNIVDSFNHEDLAAVNSDSNLEDDDEPQEIRIDPDQNEDYVVKGGIAELYEGMFRFLVINGRKFFPFEDLCHHYEKQDLISCLKSKPGHFKAIRCSVIETEFLNNLEPALPVLEENATIIEENFLHCSAKLNFRKLFDNSKQEVVDLTTDNDAVVPERLGDSPTLTPEASPTLTNPCNVSAFESYDDMIVDTSDDILMMELGTANCDTRGNDSISTKDGSSKDDLSTIDGREQKAVADAFRDIWVENHSLKSKMAMMSQDFEETKKETMDFEATCQQYGDAIELMTKAMQQTCSEDEKKDLT